MIDIKQIYWIAGLLEGEGCFGFYECPVIQVYMSDYEPVFKLGKFMAPHLAIRSRRQHNYVCMDRKTQYILRFSGNLAISWMMTLYPLMSPRRKEKIREIIIKWKAMSGKKRKAA